MFAVIKTGGKQYRVCEGDVVKLEKLPAEVGANITFDDVLMISDDKEVKVGAPYLSGNSVLGSVVSHGRHKKINILKFKRRKHHMKRMGHRQDYTEVKIEKIN